MTSIVRLGSYFDDSFAHAQLRADGKIPSRNVEVHNQIVARNDERLTIRNELRNIAADDSKLRIGIARRAPIPFVAGHPLVRCETHTFQCLMDSRTAASHHKRHSPQLPLPPGQPPPPLPHPTTPTPAHVT